MNGTAQFSIPKKDVTRRVFENSTTFLYSPNPYNQIVSIRILSQLASRHEPEEKAGMANLALRLISAGTAKHNEEELANLLEKNGGHFKAEAGKDTSAVDLLTTTHFLREDLPTVLELLDSPTFPEEKLTREREIVRMNIMENDDSLLNFTLRIFRKYFFGSHPYAWQYIGLPETLDNIKRDDLTTFAAQCLDPSQLIVTVVGGSESSDVCEILSDAFAARTSRAGSFPSTPPPAEPTFEEDTDVIGKRQSEAEYLVIGYPGPSITAREALSFRLIAAILGGSMDSRLFREIRDKRGLCYQVGSNYSPYRDLSPLMIYVVTTPQNREEVIRCAEAEVERIKNEPVPEDELNRVKTFLCGTNIMSLETNMGLATRFSTYEGNGMGWDYTFRFPQELMKVTPEEIMQDARSFLTKRLLTITAPLGA